MLKLKKKMTLDTGRRTLDRVHRLKLANVLTCPYRVCNM